MSENLLKTTFNDMVSWLTNLLKQKKAQKSKQQPSSGRRNKSIDYNSMGSCQKHLEGGLPKF